MERGFYNEDIEELLKEKADQYKMYPSDKVWSGIHRSLHSNRKWYWLSLLLFLGAVGYYTFIEFITPSATSKTISGNNTTPAPSKSTETNTTTNHNSNNKAVIVPFGNSKQTAVTNRQNAFVLNPDNNYETIAPNANTAMASDQPETPVIANNTIAATDHNIAYTSETPVYDLNTWQAKKSWQPALAANEPATQFGDETTIATPVTQTADAIALTGLRPLDASKLEANTKDAAEDKERVNWLTNNAVYELPVAKQKRWSWQLTFTPTMNYRTLREAKSYSSYVKAAPPTPIPMAMDITGNPEDLVNHKPALGFEFGSNFLYTINKHVSFKTGLQFNYIRYDIQAYSSSTSERATISLNGSYGIITGQMTSYTRYRNFGGDAVEDLANQYFQLSVPLGFEINLLGNEKLQVGITGTVQPTYQLNRNTYLITTDYKYATEPALVRRFNVNTAAGAFISYKMGDLKWQVGPQVRYQLLSSYVKEYPIREHLFNYGIQIGVAKTIR